MKIATIVVVAFLLGMALGPTPSAKAGVSGTITVTEVDPGITSVYGSTVVGFSCAKGDKNMHCYIATE